MTWQQTTGFFVLFFIGLLGKLVKMNLRERRVFSGVVVT